MAFVVEYLFIFLGGALGALSRFGVQEACRKWTSIPGWAAIFIVNVLGSFIIGFCVAWLSEMQDSFHLDLMTPVHRFLETQAAKDGVALLAVGFCGAFTTLSSFSLDNQFLYCENRWFLAYNMVGSVLLCLAAVLGGWSLGHSLAV
ncbi:MAG: CrcB family protein [Deltaproteobacteria bacterium]|nr:CrcB family protein [Deltaproteobacteria bacterium]